MGKQNKDTTECGVSEPGSAGLPTTSQCDGPRLIPADLSGSDLRNRTEEGPWGLALKL